MHIQNVMTDCRHLKIRCLCTALSIKMFILICCVSVVGLSPAWGQSIPKTGNSVPSLAQLDQSVTAVMQKYNIPGLSLGVTKAGRLIYARGFGYGDLTSKTQVQPNTLFRLASVSKPITASGIDLLVQQGKLSYNTPVFSILSDITPLPGATADPRVNQITILDLVSHYSGWSRDLTQDIRTAAQRLGLPLPGTFVGWARYELGFPLDNAPGSTYEYCNFCYDLLAQVIEEVSGVPYETFIRQNVLAKVGDTVSRVGSHLQSGRLPGEVTYYTGASNQNVATIYSDTPPTVPAPYGGFTMDWGAGAGAGAWVSNTMEMLRLAASVVLSSKPALLSSVPSRPAWAFSAFPIGTGWEWIHEGGLPGTATVLHIKDDLAWCFLTNTDIGSDQFVAELDSALRTDILQVDASNSWPSGDLFPQYLPGIGGAFVLPQVVFGGGWSTVLYFGNQSGTAVSFPVNFFSDAGFPLTVPRLESPSTQVNLPVNGTAIIELPNSGALAEGYASFPLPTGVVGYGVFRESIRGRPDQEAVVPLSSATATSSTLMWDERRGLTTFVVIINPSSVPITVAILIWGIDGNVIARSSVFLPPNGKTEGFLSTFPGLRGIVGQQGSAEFVANTGSVAVLGLRVGGHLKP